MDLLNLGLFIRIAVPLSFMLLLFKGESRTHLLFLIIGLTACLFSGEVSGILIHYIPCSYAYFIANITPIVEETAKAFPILIYVFFFKPDRRRLLENALSVGIGFAVLENAFTLFDGTNVNAIVPALARGFYSGFLHGFFTMLIGFGMSFIVKSRKLFAAGTLIFLGVSIILHSICNLLSVSQYWYLVNIPVFIMAFIFYRVAKLSKTRLL